MNNKFSRVRVEFNILQSFPVVCLNRDDVGSPKTAVVGGVVRQRVSSQCWKRQVRLALHDLGICIGIRTRKVKEKILEYCETETDEISKRAEEIAKQLAGNSMITLIFLSEADYKRLAELASGNENIAKGLKQLQKEKTGLEALDIALFGRMMANAPYLSVTGAVSFAHAITTHKATSEVDYFTAVDDLSAEDNHSSGHIGINEFSSGTYYRYVCLDLGILASLIGEENVEEAVKAFTKALYIAVPAARQATMTGFCPWDYAVITVRKGQPVQCSFDKPVKAKTDGYLAPSIEALKEEIIRKKSLMGSLYGEIASVTYGEGEKGFDDVIEILSRTIREI